MTEICEKMFMQREQGREEQGNTRVFPRSFCFIDSSGQKREGLWSVRVFSCSSLRCSVCNLFNMSRTREAADMHTCIYRLVSADSLAFIHARKHPHTNKYTHEYIDRESDREFIFG